MQFNQTNNNHGDVNNDIIESTEQSSKTIFDYICSWWGGILGGTASILGLMFFIWKEWDWFISLLGV